MYFETKTEKYQKHIKISVHRKAERELNFNFNIELPSDMCYDMN